MEKIDITKPVEIVWEAYVPQTQCTKIIGSINSIIITDHNGCVFIWTDYGVPFNELAAGIFAPPPSYTLRNVVEKPQTISFGYTNGWTATPELVKKCHKAKHPVETSEIVRCLTSVYCPICNYTYKIDSGD